MSEHSSGPWELGSSLEDHKGWRVYANGGYRVAEVPNVSGLARNEANARLIAAAPELLEVLAEYLMLGAGRCTIGRQQADKALAVIRKATGSQS